MAIVFDCPFCKTPYRLKDEFGGKTATCKNPNCRKVIPIPKPTVLTSKAVDVDAIAAAAFSDDQLVQFDGGPGGTIDITCTGCDHVWQVEASKEGKNVLCPECRKSNRVPLRKKADKADWRGGSDGKPTLAKRETGMETQGAFTTAQAGGISTQTAQEIMRERDAEIEPEERRRRLIKRGSIGLAVALVLAVGGYFLFKKRTESLAEGKMEDAVKVVTAGTDPAKEPHFKALILRASCEYRVRAANDDKEATEALNDIKLARNTGKTCKGHDRNGVLGDVAITTVALLGRSEQTAKGEWLKKEEVLKEIRQAVGEIQDLELRADVMRAVARQCAERDQVGVAVDVARQQGSAANEMLGQVGLELLRIDRDKYRPEAEKIIAMSVPGAPTGEAVSMQALRIVLGKAPAKKDGSKDVSQTLSFVALAESAALRGEFANIRSTASRAKIEDRVRALAAAAHAGSEKNPVEVGPLIEEAAKLLKGEAKGSPGFNWVVVRVCRLLGKLGKFDLGMELADTLADQTRDWAHLEVLRGRLAQASGKKAEDAWLDKIGDPLISAAAVKAREEVARHNAANGVDFAGIVKSWDKTKVQPFGTAGLMLGKQDRDRQ